MAFWEKSEVGYVGVQVTNFSLLTGLYCVMVCLWLFVENVFLPFIFENTNQSLWIVTESYYYYEWFYKICYPYLDLDIIILNESIASVELVWKLSWHID